MKRIRFTCPRCGLQLKLPVNQNYHCSRCGHFPMTPGAFKVSPRVTMPFPPAPPSGPLPPPSGPMYSGQVSQPSPMPPIRPRPDPLNVLAGRIWRWYRQKSRNVQLIVAAVALIVLVGACLASTAYTARVSQSVDATNTAGAIAQATASVPTKTPTPGTPTPTRTPRPTPTPTTPPKWTTVQSFSGSSNKKTAIFSVPNDWKLLWSCTPDALGGGNFIVEIYDSNNSFIDLPVNAICQNGATSDETEEHQAGSIYLSVTADGPWTIQIQVFK